MTFTADTKANVSTALSQADADAPTPQDSHRRCLASLRTGMCGCSQLRRPGRPGHGRPATFVTCGHTRDQARDIQREVWRTRGSGGRPADAARSAERRRRTVPPGDGRVRHGKAGAGPRYELHLRPLGTASALAPRLRRRRSLALAVGRYAQGAAPVRTSVSKASAGGSGGDGAYAGWQRAGCTQSTSRPCMASGAKGTGAIRRARCWPMRPHGQVRS